METVRGTNAALMRRNCGAWALRLRCSRNTDAMRRRHNGGALAARCHRSIWAWVHFARRRSASVEQRGRNLANAMFYARTRIEPKFAQSQLDRLVPNVS